MQLKDRYGANEIFMDCRNIITGDIYEKIKKEINSSKVLIATVGPRWLKVKDKKGKRRIDNANDTLRVEIEMAMEKGIPVIPLLVGDANRPDKKELPKSIDNMADFPWREIRHSDFDYDVKALIERIDKIIGAPEKKTSSSSSDWGNILGGIAKAILEGSQGGQPATGRSESRPVESPSLARLIPGSWQIQITYPNGVRGQGNVEIHSNGSFMTQGGSSTSYFNISGNWQVNNSNQLFLSGQIDDGYQTMPYNAVISFTQITSNSLQGSINTGEQIAWRRIG